MELREKLRLALTAGPARRASQLPAPGGRTQPRPSSLAAPPVRRSLTDIGEVHVGVDWLPLDYRHGDLPISAALQIRQTALARLAPGLAPPDLERAAFLDVETTGLAGGTGTLAFLVGVATFKDEMLRVRQFFLASPEGEPALLKELARVLSACRLIISYNGRSFDAPLMESRFVLNRLRPPFASMAHLDLLHAARRLYSHRLRSCRLGEIEQSILGVKRENDISGWAVPGIYFDFLRRGETRLLGAVFQHNRLDVLSLVTLFARISEVADATNHEDPRICLALARWDEARGKLREAAALYRTALETGALGEDSIHVLRRLMKLLRRLGSGDDMERTLVGLLSRRIPLQCHMQVLVELAKLREHRGRDFAAAERVTRKAIAIAELAESTSHNRGLVALEQRLSRLIRRQNSRCFSGGTRD